MLLTPKVTSGLLFSALIAVTGVAYADEPDEWGDHRLVPRIEGSELLSYEFAEFERVELTFGPRVDGEYPDARTLEGEHTQLLYLLRSPEVNPLQVKRAFRQGLENSDFEIEFAGSGRDELGRRFHRFDTFDRSRPSGTSVHDYGWSGDESNRHFLAASHTEEAVFVNAYIHENRRDGGEPVLRVDVVEKPEEAPTLGVVAPEPAEPPEREEQDRDEIVAAHDAEDLSAAEIEEGIVAEGRVAVRDILFEFDSAEIIDESADALATIADVLETSSELELVIVGHTDNVGDFDYNLNLSMERAQAVADWLEDRHDLEGDRLQPAGAGMMAPVATNRTEEGREQNRRVELVER